VTRPTIDPALGMDLVPAQTLTRQDAHVSIIIPAHNEAETVAEVVSDCRRSLDILGVQGEVIVSASGCTDSTADVAKDAGAHVIEAPIGKGNAIREGLRAASGDVICLVDGDIRYFGNPPLAAILVDPILRGVADATVADLYWRPLYPQMWLFGFFTPVASLLFPEMLTKVGSTPWSGQRAARRELWPEDLPENFTVDLAILLHWNRHALRLRPILTDDWMNPQRPKADLMSEELELLIATGLAEQRVTPSAVPALRHWYEAAHRLMATYQHGSDDPQEFERHLLLDSLTELAGQLGPGDGERPSSLSGIPTPHLPVPGVPSVPGVPKSL
jgi:glucosyl-3-phosphoglycerate synthase